MALDDTLPETLKVPRITGKGTSRNVVVQQSQPPEQPTLGVSLLVWSVVVISFVTIGVLQWLPFGWNVSPRIDGWTLLADVDSGLRPFIFISPDLVTRPFFFWVWIVNHHFDPNNFVLINLILMTMQIVRGTALYALMWRLFPHQRLFAYLSGALLMVFPADSGTYYEGATHVLLSFTLQLAALTLLVWYWKGHARHRWWLLVLALVLEVVSVGNYEIGDLLLLAVPLLLWWLERRITLRLLGVAVLWWIAPAMSLFVSFADAFFNKASHHSTMLETSGVPYSQKLANAFQAQYWTGYQQGYIESLAAPTTTAGDRNLAAALGITAIVVAVAIWLHVRDKCDRASRTAVTPVQWLSISATSVGVMLLGIALFLPSNQLDSFASYQPVRLFYFSAVGAVLSVTALAFAIDRGLRARNILATVMVAFVILGGAMSLMTQHEQWRDYTWEQQRLIGSIVRQTGHIDSNTLVVVIDRSNGALKGYLPFNYQFEAAMQLITDNYSIRARLCYDNDTDQADTQYCHFTPKNVQIPDIWADETTFTYAYSQVIGFVLNPDGSVTMLRALPVQQGHAAGYSPQSRFNLAAGLPPRYYSMLTYPH